MARLLLDQVNPQAGAAEVRVDLFTWEVATVDPAETRRLERRIGSVLLTPALILELQKASGAIEAVFPNLEIRWSVDGQACAEVAPDRKVLKALRLIRKFW